MVQQCAVMEVKVKVKVKVKSEGTCTGCNSGVKREGRKDREAGRIR